MEPFAENATALFWNAEAADREATTSSIILDSLCGAIVVRFVIGIVLLVDGICFVFEMKYEIGRAHV